MGASVTDEIVRLDEGERLDCGCLMGRVGVTMVVDPCKPTCSNYALIVEELRKRGKAIDHLDVRKRKLDFEPHCPYCGHQLDGFTSQNNRNTPEPGNFAICVQCFRAGVFTENDIRAATPEEQAELEADPEMQRQIAIAKDLWGRK